MGSLEDLRGFEDVAERIRTELAPVRYRRPVETIRPHRRAAPRVVSVAVAIAVVVALLPRGQAPAVAWAAEPAPVTAADVERARTACAGSAGEDVTLPPLVLLDLRGTLGIATFVGDSMVATCLLHTGGDVWRGEDYLRYEQSPLGTRTIAVETVSTFDLDGEVVTLVTGSTSAEVASVALRIPGLGGAAAKLSDGHYSIWFPRGIKGVTVHARSDEGADLTRLRLEDMA